MADPDDDSDASTEREPAPEPKDGPTAPDPAAAEAARLGAENETLKRRLLEATAELDNQAKRFARERQVVRDEITARTAREMIEVLDNLDRVVDSIPEADRKSAIAEGVGAIRAQFLEKLRALGVVRVESVNRPFDPFEHEALFEEPRADVAPGTVVGEITAGYRLGLQLVRAAKVRVAKAP